MDTLKGSHITNLKELRVQYRGAPYRILFVFDPRQVGILLLGGRKGTKRWYRETVARAEKLYEAYLKDLKREGLI